jgi:uncharacterized protein YegL
MLRRLPVYLLLDVSESMIGGPLRSVEEGVRVMLGALKRDPYALETLHVCVIAFAAKAEVLVPLTELARVMPPSLEPRPGTALGAAMRLARECINRDVVVTTPERKGDFRPQVFVMTDGEPTDEWRAAAAALRDGRPRPSLLAMGCGDEADFGVLREISGDAVHVKDLTAESVGTLFAWLSASLTVSSRAAEGPGPAAGEVSGFDRLPEGKGVSLVKKDAPAPSRGSPRLYLHASCLKTGGKWLAVYRARDKAGDYGFLEAHRLPGGFYGDGEARGPAVEGARLLGDRVCPCCGGKVVFFCQECGGAYCIERGAKSVDCPGCKRTYDLEYTSKVKVTGSEG